MKKYFILLLILSSSPLLLKAQLKNSTELHDAPVFNSLEEALSDPLRVNRLHIIGKNWKEIPRDITKLGNLQELILGGNQISFLPDFISQLKYLEIISITDNPNFQLETSFPLLAKCQNLKEIWLRQNKFSMIPENIDALASLKNLELLHLGSNELSSLPNHLGKLKSLKRLEIEMNHKLNSLPASLGNLIQLTELDAENCALQSLPKEIYQCSELIDLDIQGNQIQNLEEGISKLKKLIHLNIGGNPLKSLSPDFNQLPSLEVLDLSARLLTTFDPVTMEENDVRIMFQMNLDETLTYLSKMSVLRELIFDHCDLSELPASISKCKHLERLELEDNRIDDSHRNLIRKYLPQTRVVY